MILKSKLYESLSKIEQKSPKMTKKDIFHQEMSWKMEHRLKNESKTVIISEKSVMKCKILRKKPEIKSYDIRFDRKCHFAKRNVIENGTVNESYPENGPFTGKSLKNIINTKNF